MLKRNFVFLSFCGHKWEPTQYGESRAVYIWSPKLFGSFCISIVIFATYQCKMSQLRSHYTNDIDWKKAGTL